MKLLSSWSYQRAEGSNPSGPVHFKMKINIDLLTQNQDISSYIWTIGILTKGRLVRKELTKQAVVNALIHLENPELY